MRDSNEFEAVLAFWFGTLDEHGASDAAHTKRWFTKDPEFDAEIAKRFGSLHEEVASGSHDAWLGSARGSLALVVILDQFSRNMFRGDSRSFAFDGRALEVALRAVDAGDDKKLARDERCFLYMPLVHSEKPELQDRAVALFTALRDESEEPSKTAVAKNLHYAELHRNIVRRFGRFPHRNAVIGRTSTPEEIEFLKGGGAAF